MSENMKEKDNKECVVVQPNTGTEADMLGQILLWVDKRQNSKYPQRPHRTYQRKSKLSGVLKWFQTAPTACWRRLKAWQDKKDAQVPRYLSGVRRNKRNGK